MSDPTEAIRRAEVQEINSKIQSELPEAERARLEKEVGQTWTTQELTKDFLVLGFAAPYVVVERLSDGQKGSLQFQHWPRFYFNFEADKR